MLLQGYQVDFMVSVASHKAGERRESPFGQVLEGRNNCRMFYHRSLMLSSAYCCFDADVKWILIDTCSIHHI